jgi:predicted peptidase
MLLCRSARADDDDAPLPPDDGVRTVNVQDDDANRQIVLPTEPGDHKLKFRTHIGSRLVQMSYLLHLPPDYSAAGKKHPMLVFFHGVGECGTDLAGVYALGPMTLLKQDGGNRAFADSCPFVVLCPQCPPRGQTWDTDYICKAVAQLVDQTIKKTRTDPDRVYATGLSMGGMGTWCIAEQAPDLFAAIAPLSAIAWHPENALQQLRYISVWAVVGNDDQPRFTDGTRSMEAALKKGPLPQRFSYMVGMGHDAWYPPCQSPQFYEWMLAHRRLDQSQKKKLDAAPPTTQPLPIQPLPTRPGHYLLSFNTRVGDQPFPMDYVLYLPRGYNPSHGSYPAMLFLHEQDTIGPDFHDICMHGPDLALETQPALQTDFPFVVISPRLPFKCDWETPGMTAALLGLLNHVSKELHLDPDRISLSGLNFGATGAWKLAADAPRRFSAIAAVLTDGQLTPGDDRSQVVTTIPGRVFLKSTQTASVDRMKTLIGKSRLDWQMNALPENASALADLPVYTNHELLDWLASQHRHAAAPSAVAK